MDQRHIKTHHDTFLPWKKNTIDSLFSTLSWFQKRLVIKIVVVVLDCKIFFISRKFLANFDDFSKLCRSHAFLTLQEKKHNYITVLTKHLKRWALLEPKMFIVHHHQSIFFVLVLVLLILQPALTFETDTNYDFMNTNQKSESTEVYKSKIKYLQQSTSSNNNNNADSTSSINNVKKLTEPVVISSTNTAHHPQYLTYKYRLIQQHHHPYSAASYAYPTFTAPAPAQLYHGHQIAIHPGTLIIYNLWLLLFFIQHR